MNLQEIIDQSSNMVFFGGAGVSTESGIPDFRSADGLYNQRYSYPPEEILSHEFFYENTAEFYRFYQDKMLCLDAEPNAAHIALANLEASGKLKAVITQNIDGLHQAAGSKNVYELHGSVHRNYCTRCNSFFSAEYVKKQQGIPYCQNCGGLVKPDVVLYGEGLDNETVSGAVRAIAECDCLIVAGTSLAVQPAAGLVRYFSGSHLVLINKSATPLDSAADLVIRDKVGEVLGNIKI
ncbi:MAG: NAD-dependent protein deacylase [Eubacterium sp.]